MAGSSSNWAEGPSPPDGAVEYSAGFAGEPCPLRRARKPLSSALAFVASVIGDDDRKEVGDASRPPFRMICSLEIRWTGDVDPFFGTGWFAGPRTVVTAGHCVFDHARSKGWAKSIAVMPGRRRESFPFGRLEATRFSATGEWTRSGAKAADLGCIHLDEPVGQRTGWLAFGLPAGFDGQAALSVSGYSRRHARHSIQHYASGVGLGMADGRLFYTADTMGGASGAPVLLGDIAAATSPPRTISIHTDDETARHPAIAAESNSGPILRPEFVSLIEQWNRMA